VKRVYEAVVARAEAAWCTELGGEGFSKACVTVISECGTLSADLHRPQDQVQADYVVLISQEVAVICM